MFLFVTLLNSQLTLIIGRLFKKIELSESIRYASGDPIESWLHSLLCLDVTSAIPNINRLDDTYLELMLIEAISIIFINFLFFL